MPITLIYTTHPNLKAAKKVAQHLLKKKLIACANFFPIESMYDWKNKIRNEKETVALLKTSNKNWQKVRAEILKIHPCKTPCILKFSAEANKTYADWIKSKL